MPDGATPLIRAAGESDLSAINSIYNHYVHISHCTFDLEPWNMDKHTAWFQAMAPPWLLVVAERRDQIIGYAYSSRFRSRAAYRRSVETTVYISHEHHCRGAGTLLMRYLLDELDQQGIHCAYAGVALPNEASVKLHENLGYKYIGTYHEVGFKFDRYIDVAWYEFAFESAGQSSNTYE